MLRCSLRENAVSGCLIQWRRRRQQVAIRCTKDLRVWIVRLLRVSPPPPPPPPPPSSPPAVGVRSHIAVAASLFFFFSLSPAASICIFIFPLSPSGRYTSGRRHLAASCLAHTPARRCDFFFPGTRRGHVCTCYFQEAGCERVPRCDSR